MTPMSFRRTLLALGALGILLAIAPMGCNGVTAIPPQAADAQGATVPVASHAEDGNGQASQTTTTTTTTTGGSPRTPVDPSPTPTPTPSSGPPMLDNPNAVINVDTGLTMDVSGGASSNGTAIIQYTLHGGSNQMWQLVPVSGSASYTIENPDSGKCIDIAGNSTAAGTKVVLWDCNQAASQRWTNQTNADGTHTLVNDNSKLCLDVPNGSTTMGLQLDQATCNGGQQQRWAFTVPYPRVGNGFVLFVANPNNAVTSLTMTMLVPPKPASTGTLFLWPGLQPGGINYDPIDNGVLQPVLTWGGSCAPTAQPSNYSTWWISGQYVNTYGSFSGYTGCFTGSAMSVNVGDTLNISMTLAQTTWTQTILDVQTHQQVTYSIDMQNQAQNDVEFDIEEYSSQPVSDVVFDDVVFTMAQPQASACIAVKAGANDYVAPGVASSDHKTCTVPKIILRAQGVAATTPNP